MNEIGGLSERIVEARRRGLEPEERRRVMDAVALRRDERWLTQFGIMLGLSVLIAVMGLSANSAAVVIGAMLVAPLMTPVLGIAAALAMSLTRHLGRSALIVAGGTVGSIALAFVLGRFLPDGELSNEIVSRTSPDLRDLMVAVAAGAAGAYATVQKNASSSLPGVAVAVALVPPLGAVGLTLEAGRTDLAYGALLLYLANLAGIIAVATGVFLVTGFVPPRRLSQTKGRLMLGGLLVTILFAAIAIPLAVASVSAAADGRQRTEVRNAVLDWLPGSDELEDVRVVVEDGASYVDIVASGPTAPPPDDELNRVLEGIVGPGTEARVRWIQTQGATETPVEITIDPALEDAQARDTAIRGVVQAWLLNPLDGYSSAAAFDLEISDITDNEVQLVVSAATSPPAVDDLRRRLTDELGYTGGITAEWIQRTRLSTTTTALDGADADTTTTTIDSIAEQRRSLTELASTWAAAASTDELPIRVDAVEFDGLTAVIELVGPRAPATDDLEEAILRLVPDAAIEIYFTQRLRLTTTTTPEPDDGNAFVDGGPDDPADAAGSTTTIEVGPDELLDELGTTTTSP